MDYKKFMESYYGGKHRSAAWHADGGANDERHDLDRSKPTGTPHAVHINGKKWKTFGSQSHAQNVANKIKGATVHKEEVEISEAAPFKTKEDAVKYAKEKVKSHRDKLDGIEIHAHSGGFDVNHTSNSSGRNSLQKIGAKHLGTVYKEEVELQEGAYEKSEENKRSADAAKKQGDMFAHHLHMSDHHENLAQWHSEKGRHSVADSHAEKAEQHHEKAMALKEETIDEATPYYQKASWIKKMSQAAKQERLAREKKERESSQVKEEVDLEEGLDIIARADYKLDKAGKKSHKEIVFHNGSVDQEKDDKLKREELEIEEKLDPSMGAGEYIKDFQKSDAPQFKGKSKEKKRMMGIAAYMAAKKGMKEEVELDEAINDNLHPAGAALLKHIKPEHHNKYKAHLTTDTFNGSYKDRTDVLNAAKKAGHLKEDSVVEAKDEQEYGYEGDMAMTQLETAIRHATHLKDMMEPDTDLPEWVQSKITLATDYLQTACDYMTSEMNEALKGNQHKIDKNKNGKVDAHDFKLLRKEEAIEEAMINGREYASHGLMHPDHAAHAVHKVTGSTIDFYAHGSGDKVSGKVTKNDGKAVHIKDTSGKTHQFKVQRGLPKQQNEQAPVAPVPDKKYIKGTPENKALKASRKPINGMPTNVKEGTNFDEEGNLMAEKKTYSQFVEQLLEYESDKSGVYRHTKGSYGKSYDSEDDDKPSKAEPSAVKRGRGRPAGAKSGANQKVSSGKSYGGIATHTLNLPK